MACLFYDLIISITINSYFKHMAHTASLECLLHHLLFVLTYRIADVSGFGEADIYADIYDPQQLTDDILVESLHLFLFVYGCL